MCYDVIVVGAGPAGMTAALYALRAGRGVLLLEENAYGGQILNSGKIENYPALPAADGYTFAMNLMEQLREAGVCFRNDRVSGVEPGNGGTPFCVRGASEDYFGRSVILATGLRHRHLEIPGEAERIGHGVSFCATCDGMLYRGRKVAVVGGGNTAVQDAIELSGICETVFLIHRRDTLRAEPRLREQLQKKQNIVFLGNTVVREICGETPALTLLLDAPEGGDRKALEVAALFEAVGQIPQNEPFKAVATDPSGYFLAGEDCHTTVPGLFCAGDCRKKEVRQLTTAVADGTVAALAANAYLDTLS